MTKVIFVGDVPSNSNVHRHVAFAGAQCLPRLVEWIKVINPDFYICLNSSSAELEAIGKLFAKGYKVIALGSMASMRLDRVNIQHYMLPHPSGRNRKLNDQLSVETWLDLAKTYVEADIKEVA